MSHEMQLVEQFEEVFKEFERAYTELSAGVIELGQTAFARLREYEIEYHEKFSELVMQTFDRINKSDMDDIEEELRDLLTDKDVLINAVNLSHDYRLGRIDHQEDYLLSGAARDTDSVIKKNYDKEVTRSRTRIAEILTMVRILDINTQLDKCNSEIEAIEGVFF
jgi:hypothetical protein